MRSARRIRGRGPSRQWTDCAAEMLKRGAAALTLQGTPEFTIEQLRVELEHSLPRPRDLRHWGAAARAAAKRGFIAQVACKLWPTVSSRGAVKPVYRAGPAAMTEGVSP